ncbi:large-conductance mechanosensitive channel protein MscL [Halopseudomonas sp.]|jgi:large conductance mechanosensitive channel|uniref:large-conductance mechanosensitive channel protein MscL n=1 Tax=Halopseudomonas sp. TaxID=2901191 RepID=UPI001A4C6E88|nr:large-conductance mechanosensitive channel protein MscL [Pseudomonas sp.]
MRLLHEFKAFAMRGNVVEMAIGIIIGAAFGKVVSSFVANVAMPPLGLLIGGVDFADLAIVLREAQGELPAVTLGYGLFIQSIVDFLIVAAAIFVAIKVMNNLKREEVEEPAPPPVETLSKQEILLGEIRDLLQQQRQ